MKPSNHIEKRLNSEKSKLKKAGAKAPSLDAEVLLAHVLHIDRLRLPLLDNFVISTEKSLKYEDLIKRRIQHEPVAYIINKKEFYSIEFYVDENVLIPRPETEILVESALEIIEKNYSKENPISILEIGTGSGIISCLLAEFVPNAKIIATDISEGALEVAQRNCSQKEFTDKIEFIKSDLYSELDKERYKNYFHIIVSNPPYVSEVDYDKLAPDITEYEPVEALIGGKTGAEFTKKLIEEGIQFLKEKGCIILETGYNLSEEIKKIVSNLNMDFSTSFIKDLQNIDRVAVILKESI